MKKQTSFIIITSLIFSFLINGNFVYAQEAIQAGFTPNNLIDDSVFSNTNTFSSASGIQQFLQSKGSVLANTSESFVAQLKEPTSTILKQTLEDPQPNLNRNRTAAELIYDASRSSGLNAQVILVTLNKEQSLISGRQNATPEQLQRALDFSMGFGCPDSQPCGSIYQGFYAQLFGGVDAENNRYLGAAKSLMKSFQTPGGRGPYYNGGTSRVGDTIVLDNTLGGYEGVQPQQTVKLSNAATAALYRYTPHVFNGNYNFWRFFKAYFGAPNSNSVNTNTRVKNANLIRESSSSPMYIVENGGKYRIVPFVAKARKLDTSKVKNVSSDVLNSYNTLGLAAAPDNTLIKYNGAYYVFKNNLKQQVSLEQIKAMNLNSANAIEVELVDFASFNSSDPAPAQPTTPATPPATPAPLPSGIPPAGSLVKSASSPTIYLLENGQKKPMDGEIFRNRKFTFANLVTLTQAQIDSIPLGPFPAPLDNTYFKDKLGQLYVYRNGKLSTISKIAATQRLITPDFTFGEDLVKSLPMGLPVMPKDGTLVKGDKKAEVYLISGGLASPMSGPAFTARKFTYSQIQTITQSEMDSFPKGPAITK